MHNLQSLGWVLVFHALFHFSYKNAIFLIPSVFSAIKYKNKLNVILKGVNKEY